MDKLTLTYSGSTCIEAGYSFKLEAPEDMKQDLIEHLMREVISWGDDPTQENLDEYRDDLLCQDVEDLSDEEVELLDHIKDVTITYSETVHRDTWVNDLDKD